MIPCLLSLNLKLKMCIRDRELSQMEGRVQSDIWYMEHWTLLLDLYIIYKTIANVIVGERNAY